MASSLRSVPPEGKTEIKKAIKKKEGVKVKEKDVEGLLKAFVDADKDSKDYDETVDKKERIIEELAKIGKPAVEPLIRALGDENRQVRIGAAWALGKIKDKRAVEPLINALDDESNIVRTESAFALGEIGDKKAVKPLQAVLFSGDVAPGTMEEARKALDKIT